MNPETLKGTLTDILFKKTGRPNFEWLFSLSWSELLWKERLFGKPFSFQKGKVFTSLEKFDWSDEGFYMKFEEVIFYLYATVLRILISLAKLSIRTNFIVFHPLDRSKVGCWEVFQNKRLETLEGGSKERWKSRRAREIVSSFIIRVFGLA